ncbi:MAG: hypothetical protein IJM15_07735 [Erysipelotrichaceae bacterium]|nr:hypothetical protein [Erysipelotrichaceae bacterium]
MELITKVFTAISDLGGALAMPIVFTVFGLLVGMKFKDALRSGLLYGVGFSGLWLVLDYFLVGVADATVAISENLGLSLDVTDAGWMVGADIAFSSSLLPVSVVAIILVNVLLIAVGFLKTLNIDIWNYWIMITGGAIIYTYTGSYILGLLVVVLTSVIIAKLADIYAKNSWDAIDVPEGISLPHMDTISMAPICFVVNKVIDLIPGVRDWDLNLDSLQEKVGVFGEPVFMGFILGFVLGLFAGYGFTGALSLGMVTATTMVLMPKICSVLMEALAPIAEATQEMVMKKFNGKEVYIGMDAAVAAGHPTVLLTSIIVIPVMVLLSTVLPGNRMLPFGDLSSMALYVVWSVVAAKGNMFRSLVTATVAAIVYMYCGSFVAEAYTATAVALGAVSSGTLISSISAGNPLYSIFLAIAKLFVR